MAAAGTVRVYKQDVLDQLVGTQTSMETTFEKTQTSTSSARQSPDGPSMTYQSTAQASKAKTMADTTISSSTAATFAAEHRAAQRAQKEKQHQQMVEQTKRDTERRIADRANRREAAFNEMYAEVVKGMDNPDGILHEVDSMLATDMSSKQKKKEHLYKEWKESVYDHIQGQLSEQVDSIDSNYLQQRNNAQFDAYLNITNHKKSHNHKATVFCESKLPDEYDPNHLHAVRANVSGMFDPLKRDLIKTEKEKDLQGIDRVDYGAVPGKVTLDVTEWHRVESLPSGHFTDKEGDLKPVSVTDGSIKRSSSKVPMDHYNVQRGKAVMNAEMTKTKLIVEDHGHRKDRADFHGVVNQRPAPPGTTGGDNWLEAKGKICPPPPCDPGRPDGLYPQVNYASDHSKPGGHGDLWLSAKGKRTGINPMPPPGSRKDLFVVVNQSEGKLNPVEASGDRWIEARGKQTFPLFNDYERKPPGETKVALCFQDNDGLPI